MALHTQPLSPEAQANLSQLIAIQEATGYIPTVDEVATVLACPSPDDVTAYLATVMAHDPSPRLAPEY